MGGFTGTGPVLPSKIKIDNKRFAGFAISDLQEGKRIRKNKVNYDMIVRVSSDVRKYR